MGWSLVDRRSLQALNYLAGIAFSFSRIEPSGVYCYHGLIVIGPTLPHLSRAWARRPFRGLALVINIVAPIHLHHLLPMHRVNMIRDVETLRV